MSLPHISLLTHRQFLPSSLPQSSYLLHSRRSKENRPFCFLTGKEAEHLLDEIGITANKNTVPFETQSPFVTSGIRIGTPATTTRGFGKEEMIEIADIINWTIENKDKDLTPAKERVATICKRF